MSNSDNIDNQEAVKLEATEISMGHGKVDVGPIHWKGRTGILLHPREECIPVGQPGTLQDQDYWPVQGDVVIWIDDPAGADVIISELAPLTTPAKLDAPDNQEALAGEGVEEQAECRAAYEEERRLAEAGECTNTWGCKDSEHRGSCGISSPAAAHKEREELVAGEPCPHCGALPCDQVNRPAKPLTYAEEQILRLSFVSACREEDYDSALAIAATLSLPRTLPSNEALAGDDRNGVEGLVTALGEAAFTFETYDRMHSAKATLEGYEKAKRNAEHAARCRRAIAAYRAPRTPSSPQADVADVERVTMIDELRQVAATEDPGMASRLRRAADMLTMTTRPAGVEEVDRG